MVSAHGRKSVMGRSSGGSVGHSGVLMVCSLGCLGATVKAVWVRWQWWSMRDSRWCACWDLPTWGEGGHSDIKTKGGMKEYRLYCTHNAREGVWREFRSHSLRNEQIIEQMCISILEN